MIERNEIVEKLAKYGIKNKQNYICYIPTSNIVADVKKDIL